jgi:hypothetical protein
MKSKVKFEPHLIKFYVQRLGGYFGMGSFLILIYEFVIVKEKLGLQWYHWICIFGLGLFMMLYYDLAYVHPREVKYGYEKNTHVHKEFKKLNKKVDKIMKVIKNENFNGNI